ncbi:hypothetical protein K438DRAFT_1164150 [Mycena galopus ATCC 62051]|nr:hypothetical protein K438DRAFT_1164150 [Mycena galopus ATCC 62051]
MAVVKMIDPDAAHDLCAGDGEIGLAPLGSTRCTLFCCHNYMSCGHSDHDALMLQLERKRLQRRLSKMLSVSVQYTRKCLPDEYLFVYSEWGVVLYPEPGCVWLFDSSHVHQVTLPRRSTLKNATVSVCTGAHLTTTARNSAKAVQLLQAQRSYEKAEKFWKEQAG